MILTIQVERPYFLQRNQDFTAAMAQVDGIEVSLAFTADVDPINTRVINKTGKLLLIIVPAIRALQTLKQPLSIAAETGKPAGTIFFSQICKIGLA